MVNKHSQYTMHLPFDPYIASYQINMVYCLRSCSSVMRGGCLKTHDLDPYIRGKLATGAYAAKIDLCGYIVAVLRGVLLDRSLELIPQPSRAILEREVHELIITDEPAEPGSRVSRVAYLAFVEFHNGGVLLTGDSVLIGGVEVGHIAGFDLSHFPNHMNLVVRGDLVSGEDRGIELHMPVAFQAVDRRR